MHVCECVYCVCVCVHVCMFVSSSSTIQDICITGYTNISVHNKLLVAYTKQFTLMLSCTTVCMCMVFSCTCVCLQVCFVCVCVHRCALCVCVFTGVLCVCVCLQCVCVCLCAICPPPPPPPPPQGRKGSPTSSGTSLNDLTKKLEQITAVS